LREIIPQLVRKYRTFSPIEIRKKILQDYNTAVTPEAITMFFKRHQEVETELRKEVVSRELENEVIEDSIFKNGAFEELPSVKQWLIDKTGQVSEDFLKGHIGRLKNVCQGIFYLGDSRRRDKYQIPNWTLKHPDRLTLQHAKEFLYHMRKAKRATHDYRLALRSFFQSRGIIVQGKDISGEVENVGNYNNVYVEKGILEKIFDYVKQKDYEAYLIDKFMFKTATRLQASLDIRKKAFWKDEQTHMARVVDKGLHRKGRQTWDKIVPLSLMEEIEKVSQEREDRIFLIPQERLSKINKEAYRVFLKDDPRALGFALREPNHFWRHMFAQHMLRATKWNYVLVAKLGGWKNREALIESYGMPPSEMIRREGLSTIPEI
jgi:integrase